MRLSSSFYSVASPIATRRQATHSPKFGIATTTTKPQSEYDRFTYHIASNGQNCLTLHRPDSTFKGPGGTEYSIVQWNPEQLFPAQSNNYSLRTPGNYMLLVQLASDINRINAIGIDESQQHYVKGNIPEGWAADRATLKRGDKPGKWHTALNQTIEQLQSRNYQYELLFRFKHTDQVEELMGFSFVETLAPRSKHEAPQKELHAIYLHPDVRKLGIGARLLRNVIDRALQESCGRIILDVGPKNKDAISLYKAAGFNIYNEFAPVPWGDQFLLLHQLELTSDQFKKALSSCRKIITAKQITNYIHYLEAKTNFPKQS